MQSMSCACATSAIMGEGWSTCMLLVVAMTFVDEISSASSTSDETGHLGMNLLVFTLDAIPTQTFVFRLEILNN